MELGFSSDLLHLRVWIQSPSKEDAWPVKQKTQEENMKNMDLFYEM